MGTVYMFGLLMYHDSSAIWESIFGARRNVLAYAGITIVSVS